MTTPAITDETFGAWVLKCNPKTWDLEGFLAKGENFIESWSVQDNYRSARMRPGDPVVLWVTGATNAAVAPGIWGVGYVTEPVNFEVVPGESDDLESESDETSDSGFWLDEDRWASARFFVATDLTLDESPLGRAEIQANPILRQIEILRQPAMGNPSWLNAAEWAELQRLRGDDALEPMDPVELSALEEDAKAQRPDPLTRQVIELLAVIHVSEKLLADGWTVDDVQSQNVGWDLTASRGDSVRYIEVKGRAPREKVVLLTSYEMRAAGVTLGWELALVTGALSTPDLTWYSAESVTNAAVAITYRAALG